MHNNKFYLFLLFSVIMFSSCKSRLDSPIIFKFVDQNIDVSASFSEFSKKENLYYGNIKVRNLNPNKEVVINKTVINSDKQRYDIEPDYLIPIYLMVSSLNDYQYKVVLSGKISSEDKDVLKMVVYYTTQNDIVPNYKLKTF